MTELPQRKVIRLSHEVYRDPDRVCSLTLGVRERRPVFADPTLASTAVEVLGALAARTGVRVYAYCVMPDHVHLVISPTSQCDVFSFVGQFKNLVLREAWRLSTTGSFWQSSFWDHLLRKEEDLKQVVRYVLYNPVRKGMAAAWHNYAFAGSLVFTHEDLE